MPTARWDGLPALAQAGGRLRGVLVARGWGSCVDNAKSCVQ
ncbi:MAG: hypothetical protein OXG81_12065 [Acidobacteria bacterium]|nr:hypothetical protein [Acidobacteriota bacterium]